MKEKDQSMFSSAVAVKLQMAAEHQGLLLLIYLRVGDREVVITEATPLFEVEGAKITEYRSGDNNPATLMEIMRAALKPLMYKYKG